MSGVELCTDCRGGALLNEAEQFGLYVVAGELARELPGALTVTRLSVDLVDGTPDCFRVAWLVRRSIPAPDHWT
jgi:hypothetical protein